MLKALLKLLFPVCFLFLLSCTAEYTFSILKPAESPITPKIQRISVFPVPAYINNNKYYDSLLWINDAVKARTGYVHGIYRVLSDSGLLEKVVLSDTSFCRLMHEGEIYWEDLMELCRHDSTDYVLLLVKAVSHKLRGKYFAYTDETEATFYGVYDIINVTDWLIVCPESKKRIMRMSDRDTLEISGFFGLHAETDDILYNSCYSSGIMAGTKICPSWYDVNRIYYTSLIGPMHKAARLIRKNNWEKSSAIWYDLSEGPNHRLAAKAASNLALAWEMEDEINQSLSWIAYADSLSRSKKITAYKKELEKRRNEREVLNLQIY